MADDAVSRLSPVPGWATGAADAMIAASPAVVSATRPASKLLRTIGDLLETQNLRAFARKQAATLTASCVEIPSHLRQERADDPDGSDSLNHTNGSVVRQRPTMNASP